MKTYSQQILILCLVLYSFQVKLMGQSSNSQSGIYTAGLSTVKEFNSFKTGTGFEMGVWYQRPMNKSRILMMSLNYRKLIGYEISSTHSITYNYPTIQLKTSESTHLSGLQYLDADLGIKWKIANSSFSWGVGLRLSKLLNARGAIIKDSSYKSIEEDPIVNSRFLRYDDTSTQALNQKDFNSLDIGPQLQLCYDLNPYLSFRVGGYHGLRKVIKQSFSGQPLPLHNSSISLGCFVKIL